MRVQAMSEGMTTLLQDGIIKALKGYTISHRSMFASADLFL